MPKLGGTLPWKVIQLIGVTATLAVMAGLVFVPQPTLGILWNLIIPLVPASLLVSPALWRNVCPLATLGTATNGLVGRRTLRARAAPTVGMVGIILLLALVPARRFLFNTDGPALAVTIGVVALLALMLGAVFDLKAGFCNALCPVLPVERLYGQRPLLNIGNARCLPCTLCTQAGCLDLSPTKSLRQILGPARRSARWLLTGFGAFAAAFPGFVVGYYTTRDGPLSTGGAVYLHVVLWMAVSYLTVAMATTLGVAARYALPALAAVSAGLYYWFAAPLVAEALRLGAAGAVAIRAAAFALAVAWLLHAFVPAAAARVRGTEAHP